MGAFSVHRSSRRKLNGPDEWEIYSPAPGNLLSPPQESLFFPGLQTKGLHLLLQEKLGIRNYWASSQRGGVHVTKQ